MFLNFPSISPSTAASISQSSNTINGALPPSSKESFFTVFALCCIKILPTAVLPVNEIFLTFEFEVISLPISSGSPVIIFITPFGNPACSARTTNAIAVSGVCSAGLIIKVHPAASPGAHFLVIIAAGKFQGVIAAQTPMGCLRVIMRLSFIGSGRTSP